MARWQPPLQMAISAGGLWWHLLRGEGDHCAGSGNGQNCCREGELALPADAKFHRLLAALSLPARRYHWRSVVSRWMVPIAAEIGTAGR